MLILLFIIQFDSSLFLGKQMSKLHSTTFQAQTAREFIYTSVGSTTRATYSSFKTVEAVGVAPQLMLGCGWYAPLLTHSVNTQLALYEVWDGAPWCYWSVVGCDRRATCSWSRLTALLLGDCCQCACSSLRLAWWGVLFSEARWSRRDDLAGSH
jgi:hypothetical protein